MGIPVIGCHCLVCTSKNPKNRRLRSSALLQIDGKRILIDAGPDFRAQALNYKIDALDGVIFTHSHQDHIGGVDELRAFILKRDHPIPCLLSQTTLDEIKVRYSYIFQFDEQRSSITTKFEPMLLKGERGEVSFLDLNVRFFTFEQAKMPVNGFRFGSLAYVSDICHYSDTIFEDLQGVETLILSALRFAPTPFHFTVDQAIAFTQRVAPKRAYFMHIAHELDCEEELSLPKNMHFAYDGLEIKF